jgi:homoserine/homoserine lactone efflux protein
MSFDVWLTLLIASFLLSISPGAGAVVSINSGISYGLKKSYFAIFGLQAGYLLQAFGVVVGIGAIIASSAFLFNLIKWIGVAYLVYLGLTKIFQKVEINDETIIETHNPKKMFISAFFVNITNPKSAVFLVAFLPQLLNPSENILVQFLIIGLTLIIVDIIVMTGYSGLASRLKFLLKDAKSIKKMNIITGSFLIIAASFLSFSKK